MLTDRTFTGMEEHQSTGIRGLLFNTYKGKPSIQIKFNL